MLDADFIIGHDIENDLRFLLNQMNRNVVKESSILGRWRYDYKKMRNIKNYEFLSRLTFGRLVLDTHSGAKEFKREVDYDIRYLAKKYFNIKFDDKNEGNDDTFQAHQREIDYLFRELATSVKLNEKIQNLQLTKQLTNVGGCLWTHSLKGQRAVRIEYLLMHNFHKHDYIIPDKIRMQKAPGGTKKSTKFKGGYVLEPKAGLHQNYTLLLDFKSLYPSIIRRYNLCYTTVKRENVPLEFYTDYKVRHKIIEESPDPADMVSNHQPKFLTKKQANEQGVYILPFTLENLIDRRGLVKREMKDVKRKLNSETISKTQRSKLEDKLEALDIKQLAVKVVANSIYGSLGFKTSRFYSKDIAAMVTYYGRSLLKKTIEVVEQEGYEVLYGDTDSVMVNSRKTDWQQALRTAISLRVSINKIFPKSKGQMKKIIEIEIDGLFSSLLLYKKKKYAAMMIDNYEQLLTEIENWKTLKPIQKLEIKGLDMIRRDWSGLTKNSGTNILKMILKKGDRDDIIETVYTYLETLMEDINNDKINHQEYVIYKMLTKSLSKYKNIQGLPHVLVAKRLIDEGHKTEQQLINHAIPYIICENRPGEKLSESQRAYHVCEFIHPQSGLKVDKNFYIKNQLSNPIGRLLQSVQGINFERIATILKVSKADLGVNVMTGETEVEEEDT